MDGLIMAVQLIMGLSLLVILHEFGHYIVARSRNVGVTEFGVGMGPKLFSFKDKFGTNWCICALPIGGYIQPKEKGDEGVVGDVFDDAKPLDGVLVALAGPFFNFVSAILILLSVGFYFGQPGVTNIVHEVKSNSIVFDFVKSGDVILFVNDKKFNGAKDFMGLEGAVKINVQRNGEMLDFSVYKEKAQVFGVLLKSDFVKIGFFKSISFAFQYFYNYLYTIITMFGQVIMQGKFSGPIGILSSMHDAANISIGVFLLFVVNISISLAFFNLLPFPVVDGGRVVMFLFVALTGRKVNKNFEKGLNYFGIGMLVLMMLVSSYNDIQRML